MGGRRQAVYPWDNYYLRNRKGEYLCNFKRAGDESIVRNRQTGQPEVVGTEWSPFSESGFYTMKVKSYAPNNYGLYNVCGNAAEMIAQKGIAMGGSWNDFGGDITTKSEASYTGFAFTVGFRPVIIVKEKR
jgi:Sulfatase-modifying factor enzyme 1